jgi:hypothetical protein
MILILRHGVYLRRKSHAVQSRPCTVEEFDQIAAQPENADRRLEDIGGQLAGWLRITTAQKLPVEVYAPRQKVQIVRIDGTLDGGGVLPGFARAVKDIFPE